jgi:lipopolysaccharide export system permease protein
MTFIKKTDKIVLLPFIRLFSLVLIVTLFIILMQFILVWFNELIGKDFGFWVYCKLLLYFGINATPFAFPLATLVASLIVFGTLAEQLELTGLKSVGISFLQTLRPLLIFISFLCLFSYFSNGYLVPKVTVKAYNLLYDLRKTRPTVAIKEGSFYNGIPGYSIRVEKKLPDQKTLQHIIIYKHEKNTPNSNVTVASAGRLTNLQNGKYLVIELFDGHTYVEQMPSKQPDQSSQGSPDPDKVEIPDLYRTSFKQQRVLINLDEFKLNRTPEEYFTYYNTTKNNRELDVHIDSLRTLYEADWKNRMAIFQKHYPGLLADNSAIASQPIINPTSSVQLDTSSAQITIKGEPQSPAVFQPDEWLLPTGSVLKELERNPQRRAIIQKALKSAQEIKQESASSLNKASNVMQELKRLQLERNKRASYALGCLIMLLIGASLGGLIKKGGLGVPLLISTIFILLYYVIDIFGTRWVKTDFISVWLGAWGANLALLPLALFFLLQAQRDTRLLDGDAYRMRIKKIGLYRKK